MITIYHNSRCSKSRLGLAYLEEKGIEFETINYLTETPFTVESLSELIEKTDLTPEDLVRKHESLYKTDFRDGSYTDAEWIEILVKYPKLIHRPIVTNGTKAVWAQPAEKIDGLL